MSEYKLEDGLRLRQKVRAVVMNSGGEVLLVRPHGYSHDEWTLAGGGVESGETVHQAMRREIAEELGICVTEDMRQLPVTNRFIYSQEYKQKRALDHDGQNAVMFLVKVETGAAIKLQTEEIAEARWFTLSEAAGAFPAEKQRAVFEDCIVNIEQEIRSAA